MVIARGLRNANVQLEVVLEKLVVAVLNPHLVLVLGTGFHGFDLPRICALRSQRCSSRVHNQLELVEVVEVSDGQRGDEVASERYDFDEPFVRKPFRYVCGQRPLKYRWRITRGANSR